MISVVNCFLMMNSNPSSDLYTRWSSLKERFIIPKRKEPLPPSDHHHHNHHHRRHSHSSKHSSEENSSRHYYSSRSSSSYYSKSIDRPTGRRSFNVRDLPKNNEEQLSRDERRRLFEQQYEDEERVRITISIIDDIRFDMYAISSRQEQRQQRLFPFKVKVQVSIISKCIYFRH